MKKSCDLHIRLTKKQKDDIILCAKKENLSITNYLLSLHNIYRVCKDMEFFISNGD